MWRPNFHYGYAFGFLYLASIALGLFIFSWSGWLAIYAIHAFIFCFGVSFGLHRCIGHRMAPADSFAVRFAALVGTLANVGSPIDFLITHNLHHQHSDSDQDPQNAAKLGWRLLFLQVREVRVPARALIVSRESMEDPFFRWLHRWYYLLLLLFFGGLLVLGGWKKMLLFGVIPSGLSFFSMGFLNYSGHRDTGYRNHNGQESRNVPWLWPYMLGECWHNNHHKTPSRRSYRERWWEFDPASWFFVFVRKPRQL